MKLANLLMDRRIKVDLRSRTKADAVNELLDLLRAERVELDYDDILNAVRDREDIEDTSYGRGFAFPHARTNAVKELYILAGVSRHGLDEVGPDGVVKSWLYAILMIDRGFADFGASVHCCHLHFVNRIEWVRNGAGRIYSARMWDEEDRKSVV